MSRTTRQPKHHHHPAGEYFPVREVSPWHGKPARKEIAVNIKTLLPLVKAALEKSESNVKIFEGASNPCIVKEYHRAQGEVSALGAVLDAIVLNSRTQLNILAGKGAEKGVTT